MIPHNLSNLGAIMASAASTVGKGVNTIGERLGIKKPDPTADAGKELTVLQKKIGEIQTEEKPKVEFIMKEINDLSTNEEIFGLGKISHGGAAPEILQALRRMERAYDAINNSNPDKKDIIDVQLKTLANNIKNSGVMESDQPSNEQKQQLQEFIDRFS